MRATSVYNNILDIRDCCRVRDNYTPVLKQVCIQANVNVVALEISNDSTFDYWLRISTWEKRKTIRVPVKLAGYHRKVLQGKTINGSVTLAAWSIVS